MEATHTAHPPDPSHRSDDPHRTDREPTQPEQQQQLTRNLDPVAMDTPTETPHDLFCLAKEFELRGRLPDAANLYLKAAMNGHLSAMVSYATHLVQSDERTAFVWFRAAAERGDARAWSELGQLLARGRYFEVDAIDAARCWKRAAQMGDNAGKSSLGLCYIRGFGVKQDAEKGVEIVRQVADVHGDVPAMKNLAWIYRYGKGVPKNLHQAEYWDNRAKKQEKILAHIASRERALFGRGRHTRSRYKNREYDPTTTATRETIRDPANTFDREQAERAALVKLEERARRSRDREAKTKALVEADLESRLRQVSEQSERQAPQYYDSKPVPAAEVATEDSRLSAQDTSTPAEQPRPVTLQLQPEVVAEIDSSQPEEHHQFLEEQYDTPHAEEPLELTAEEDSQADQRDSEPRSEKTDKVDAPQEEDEEHSQLIAQPVFETQADTTVESSLGPETPATDDHSAEVSSAPQVFASDNPLSVEESNAEAVSSERALQEFKAKSEEPKAELGQAIDSLNFVPSTSVSEIPNTQEIPFLPTTSFPSVQASQSPKAVQQKNQFSEELRSSEPSVAQRAFSEDTGDTALSSAINPAEEHPDETFLTPDQSLIEDESVFSPAGNSSLLRQGVSSKAVGGEQRNTEILIGNKDTYQKTNREGATVAAPTSTVDPTNSDQEVVVKASFSDSEQVESKAHEADDLAQAASKGEEEQLTMRKAVSYKLTKTAEYPLGVELEQSLDEFEEADLQKLSSEEGVPAQDMAQQLVYSTADQTVTCKITKASSFTRDTIPGVHNTGGIGNDGGYGNDEPSLANLQEALSLYPTNPLRSDSQVPLFKLLNIIHRLPLTNTEAFKQLEETNGFYKIVVAMLAQSDDEFLQDVGLHAFVRVVRATPSSQRESLILASYAECYRRAQGNEDAVIPKGPLGIDETTSGAIQAIVQAMRFHDTIRRVQLAGCAALAEVAAVSSSCRSQAYEYGAIPLIIACLRHRSTKAACMVHEQACVALGGFCNGKENFVFKEAFTNAGAVPELLNVLQLWGHDENDTSELLTTATKSCCCAIRHITDGCSVASAQCVSSFAYHHLVRVMVLFRSDVAMCTLVVSALTSITRNAGSIAEKKLMDAKPLPEVLIAMKTHSTQPLFVRKALDFMESLGNFNSMKEEIVMAGGIPFAADIVRQGGNDSLLLERACGVVEKLCRTNVKNQDIFATHEGVASISHLLDTHGSLPGVAERALLALTSACANNPKNQREAVDVGACDQVVKVLSSFFTKNAKVVAAATNAMSALVVPKNAPVTQTFAQLKAPELVVRAMKRHPDNVMVQENGSAAIASFCEADPRVTSMLLKSGISSVLVVALQRYLHKQAAVLQIVRAMRAISNEASEDSYRFKSKLLTDRSNESSLSEIFHTALSHHKKSLPETGNVIISICATINRLCMRSVAFKNEVGKDGIVEELKLLVEKTSEYKELGALQPVLATICTLVLDSEENKNRFHTAGGVEAILKVMQQWKSDTYVLEHCCAALRYSCNDHFGNCDEVKTHNGVRSILGVMELHPENVNVSLWCCLTLADLCKGDEALQSSPNVVQGIRKAVSAMSLFSSNSRFLASACEFLRAASVDNPENQERIVRLGGRTAMVKAMETHPGDNNLTESAAYALLQIQDIQYPRQSVDSQPSEGLVKRLSRDLRRSGSTSHRSRMERSGGSGLSGLLGRKSRSFSSKRRPSQDHLEDALSQTGLEETQPSRPSLRNFARVGKRRSRRRGRHSRLDEVDDEDEFDGAPIDHEPFREGADDGYGEFDDEEDTSQNVPDPQMD